MSPCYDLDLENSTPIFLHALKLMMMNHNTKCDNKLFGGLEHINWTNTDILTLHCDLDFDCSYPICCHKTLWLMMMYHQIKFGCQKINSPEDTVERVIF